MLRRILLLALAVYAATIPLPNYSLLPEHLRLRLYDIRPHVLLALLLVALGERIYHLGGGKLLPSQGERRIFGLSLLFPAYYLIDSLIKGTYNAPVIGLYVAWSLFAFLLAPMLMRTVRDIRVVAGLVVGANAALWAYSAVYERVTSVVVTLIYGGPYGYINGDYFAQVVLTIVAAALIFITAGGAEGLRWKWWQVNLVLLGLVSAGVFVAILAARSAVAFLAMGALAYLLLRRGHNIWVIHLLLITGAVLAVYALAFPENRTLDNATSGRLSVWQAALETIGSEPSPGLAILTGTTDAGLQTASFVARYDPISSEKVFSKFHIDNSFLELILEGGILGFILFLLPYAEVFRTGLAFLRKDQESKPLTAIALSLLVGLAFLSLTATTVPTFNSPIGFFAALFGALPAIVPRLRTDRLETHACEPVIQAPRFTYQA